MSLVTDCKSMISRAMKKLKFWKIGFILFLLYFLYLISITAINHFTYYNVIYLKDGFRVQSESVNDFKLIDFDLLNINKREDAFSYLLEYYKKDSSLVKANFIYNSISKTDILNKDSEYGIGIYLFKKKKKFSLNQVQSNLKNCNWDNGHQLGYANLFSYEVNKRLGMKGNLEINSLQYYYKGTVISEKDTLNGRLKTILIYPKIFEIGFDNEDKRMIYVEPTKEKQPLSISFFEKGNNLFIIFLSSTKNKITENSIWEFIQFE